VQWNGATGTGVVAIPQNDNIWPEKNREHAEALIKEKCPHGYTILDEHEVVMGGETDHLVTRVGYMHVHETTYHPRTEWQIVFRSADALPVVAASLPTPPLPTPPPTAIIPTRGMLPPPTPAAVVTPPTPPGLPPAPIPVGQ
jgi:hypothetical protein